MKNFKRLFKMIKGRYRYLVISLVMILIIQLLELVSPILVMNVLDEGLSGVEYPWVIVETLDDKTIEFNGKFYKQERHLTDDDNVLGDASVVIIKRDYYLIEDKIEVGTNEIVDDGASKKLQVTTKDNVFLYNVIRIEKEDVRTFYSPIETILWTFIILITIKTVVNIICSFIQRVATNKIINGLAKDGRTMAFQAVERLPLKVFESEPFGKTASRIISDVDGLINLYRLVINVCLSAVLSFIFAYVGMFYLDPKLALLSFIIYPLAFLWIKVFLKYLKKIAVKVNESRSLITAKINEIINGIHILQIFNFKKQTA